MKSIKNSLMNVIKNQNEALVDLIFGVLICGGILILAGVIIASDKISFLLGALLGTASSIVRAVHMSVTLERQMDCLEKEAIAYAARNYAIRYVFIMLVMIISVKLGTTGMVATILGIFILKPAAILQPYTHRYIYSRFFAETKESLADVKNIKG